MLLKGTHSCRIVVVSMDRKDRDRYIDIGVFVVDMIESSDKLSTFAREWNRSLTYLPFESFGLVAQHLQLARLLSQTIHPQRSHDMVHGLPGGFCQSLEGFKATSEV